MNKLILMGRLTRDPEIRYSQGENSYPIARFSLAVNRNFHREGEPEADFFNCTAFRSQAEFVEKYLKKGSRILLIGRVQNDNYTNKEGQKIYSIQVIAEELEFAETKKEAEAHSSPTTAPADEDGFMQIPEGIDEELPFK